MAGGDDVAAGEYPRPAAGLRHAERAAGTGRSGEFVFRLPRERREFFVAIYHPGWLRYFKAGPFTSADFTDDAMTLEIPRPGTLAAEFQWGDRDVADLPFKGVSYQLMRQLQAGGNSYLSAASNKCALDDTSMSIRPIWHPATTC